MTVPLVVLAVFAAIAGFINLPFADSTKYLENWLEPVTGRYGAEVDYSNGTIILLLTISTIVALTGIGIAYLVYRRKQAASRRRSSSRCSCTAGTTTGPSAPSWAVPVASRPTPWPGSTARSSTARSTASGRSPATRAASSAAARPAWCAPTRSALTIGAVLLVLFVLTRVNW